MKRNVVKNGFSEVNKVKSVFALLARSSFYKVLVILAIMVIGEILAFRYCMTNGDSLVLEKPLAPEAIIDDAYVALFFLAALGLVMMVLVWTEGRMSEKAGYTMMRLRLSRKQLFAVKTIYNAACLAIVFVVQIWLGIWMVCTYREYVELNLPAPQLLFMTFYRNKFLHCVLPMQEIGKWIRNLLMITSLSMGAAGVIIYPGEKGNKYSGVSLLTLLLLGWFVSEPGKNLLDMLCDLVYLCSIAWEIFKVRGVFGRLEARREGDEE